MDSKTFRFRFNKRDFDKSFVFFPSLFSLVPLCCCHDAKDSMSMQFCWKYQLYFMSIHLNYETKKKNAASSKVKMQFSCSAYWYDKAGFQMIARPGRLELRKKKKSECISLCAIIYVNETFAFCTCFVTIKSQS